MPYLSCKKIENDVYNFPTWQYCKYKDIFDSRIIINSTAKFYISISYQKDLLSIDTRIFTPSQKDTIWIYYTDIDIIKLNGSVELGPLVELSDVIVDIVETGSTLKENGLEVLEEVCPLSARMIVNPVSMQMEADRIRKLVGAIREQLKIQS